MKQVLGVFLLLATLGNVLAYKILLVVPPPAKSHYILMKAQADILHEKGHEVTIISPFKSDVPYRQIVVKEITSLMEKDFLGFEMRKYPTFATAFALIFMHKMATKVMFNNEDFKLFFDDKNEKFDLIIAEWFMTDFLLAFGVKYDCPVIVSAPHPSAQWLSSISGNSDSPANVPHFLLGLPSQMSLAQRVVNTAMSIFDVVVDNVLVQPFQRSMYKKYFPEEASRVPYSELMKKFALAFISSHPSITTPMPLLPNIIEIGGSHVDKSKPLPEYLQKILDEARHGAIFFSMGSSLKSSTMPPEMKSDILKTLGKLKQTVLWKFEEDLPGKPDNVIISKWMPQTSILAHPNLKLFITHGGLLSLTEAASSGVPLIVIPIFGDQYHNAEGVVERGYGVSMEFDTISEEVFTGKINQVLDNPEFEKKAKHIQKLFHDRPMSPQELVNYYAEFVIRTGGAGHLSQPEMCLASRLLLDVMAVTVLPSLLVALGMVLLCKKCLRKKSDKSEESNKKLKNKNE